MLTRRKDPCQCLTSTASVPGSCDVNKSLMTDGSKKCFQALWFSESIDLFWDTTLKEVILIAHDPILHHSLSNLLVQIFKSKSLQWYISTNMSVFLSICALSLWVWSWSSSEALEEIGSISSSEIRIQPPTSSIHLPAEMGSRCDVRGRVFMFVHDRTCRWLCPLPGGGPLFRWGPLGPSLELWLTWFRFGFFWLLRVELEFQTLPVVFAGTHNRAWVFAGMEWRQSQN